MRTAVGAFLLVVTAVAVLLTWLPHRSKPTIVLVDSSATTTQSVDSIQYNSKNDRVLRNGGRRSDPSTAATDASFETASLVHTDATIPPLLSLVSEASEHETRRTVATEKHRRNVTDLIREAFPGQYGWVFVRYVPSKLEDDYYAAVEPYDRSNMSWDRLRPVFGAKFEAMNQAMRSRVVPHAPLVSTDLFRSQCTSYIQRTNSGDSEPLPPSEGGCLADTSPLDSELFSRFEYQFVCLHPPCPAQSETDDDQLSETTTGGGKKKKRKVHRVGDTHTSYIESLGGSMRHPKVFINEVTNSLRRIDWNYLFRKDYMIVDKWALNNLYHRWALPKKTSHLLDLGSSTFSQGTGGASQPWFFGVADCMCVPFTTARFWEAAELRADGVWLDVPKERRPRYHWYNYPLSAEDDSWRNPLNHLLSTAAVGDVGIVKVDFEAPILEARIVERIIQLPELHARIDELFFEHHVRNGPMQNLWQQIITKDCGCRCTMDLFRRLRRVGVRAHSWV